MQIDCDETLKSIKAFCLPFGLGENYTKAYVEDSILKVTVVNHLGWWIFKKEMVSTLNWLRLDTDNQPIREMPFGEHKTIVYS